MTALLLGLDTGLSSTRAVVFDGEGAIVGSAVAATPRTEINADRTERDPMAHWELTAAIIRAAVADAGRRPEEIVGVGLAGHGDGLCFVDESLTPTAPAVLSTDTRALAILRGWASSGLLGEALAAGGSIPFAGSPAPLLARFGEHAPEVLARSRWLLTAKDWIRCCLTGELATDPTDAFSSFTEVTTGEYSDRLFSIYNLASIRPMLPAVRSSTARAGVIIPAAAKLTGLAAGTPVVTGLHDVIASHLGTAGQQLGHAAVVAGTFGINVILSNYPVRSQLVTCRPAAAAGQWTVRRTSLGSGANVDWAVDRLGGGLDPTTSRSVPSVAEAVTAALSSIPAVDAPVFVPHLFGGPWDGPQTASFVGLRAAHTQLDMLRAVVYGVTFKHRSDLGILDGLVPVTAVHLTGGAARNAAWAQLFADALGRPIDISASSQTDALGAALCAAVGCGVWPDLGTAFKAMQGGHRTVDPDPDTASRAKQLYQNHLVEFRKALP